MTKTVESMRAMGSELVSIHHPEIVRQQQFPQWTNLSDSEFVATILWASRKNLINVLAAWAQINHRLTDHYAYSHLLNDVGAMVRVVNYDNLDVLQAAPLDLRMTVLLKLESLPQTECHYGDAWWNPPAYAVRLALSTIFDAGLDMHDARLFWDDVSEKFELVHPVIMIREVSRFVWAKLDRPERMRALQAEVCHMAVDAALGVLGDAHYVVGTVTTGEFKGEPQRQVVKGERLFLQAGRTHGYPYWLTEGHIVVFDPSVFTHRGTVLFGVFIPVYEGSARTK